MKTDKEGNGIITELGDIVDSVHFLKQMETALIHAMPDFLAALKSKGIRANYVYDGWKDARIVSNYGGKIETLYDIRLVTGKEIALKIVPLTDTAKDLLEYI